MVHTFTGGADDGAYAGGSLITDGAGNFYGTTGGGGSKRNCGYGRSGCGTVFEIPAGGTETMLYSFEGGTDGAYPIGGLTADKNNLYGTTYASGANGYGTVFKLNK